MAMDAIGREFQLATAQLDFVQPARFELVYADSDGKDKMPVMIHLAIAGSIERFLSVYIEHTAGNFPMWLSPVQAVVLPIGENHLAFAREVFEQLKEAGIRTELDDRNETLGKKIRDWKLAKSPYALVLGDTEVESKHVTLESRGNGTREQIDIAGLIERLHEEIKTKQANARH